MSRKRTEVDDPTAATKCEVSRERVWQIAKRISEAPGDRVEMVTDAIFVFARLVTTKQSQEFLELSWRFRDPSTGKKFGGGSHKRTHLPRKNMVKAIASNLSALLSSQGVRISS